MDVELNGLPWSGRYFEACPAPEEGNPYTANRWVVRGRFRNGSPSFWVGLGGEYRAKLYAQALDAVEPYYVGKGE